MREKKQDNSTADVFSTDPRLKPQSFMQGFVPGLLCLVFLLTIFTIPSALAADRTTYTIQLGSYPSLESAERIFTKAQKQMQPSDLDELRIVKIGSFYTVRIGTFDTSPPAQSLLGNVKRTFSDAMLMKVAMVPSRIVKSYSSDAVPAETAAEPVMSAAEPAPMPAYNAPVPMPPPQMEALDPLDEQYSIPTGSVHLSTPVIVQESLNLLDAPDRNARPLLMVEKGSRAIELARTKGYSLILLQASQDKGWMPSQVLKTAGNTETFIISLDDLGYKNGYLIEGPETDQIHNLYFPIPRDVKINSGRLFLHLAVSANLHELASLRVDVNGTPRTLVRLSGKEAQEKQAYVDLKREDFVKGAIQVTFHATMLMGENRCLDERILSRYLHIMPDTSTQISVNMPAATVRAYWTMLPQTVRISLPDRPLSQQEFVAAWRLADLLNRQGKEISFTRLPRLGDVIVAPSTEIRQALDQLYLGWMQQGGKAPYAMPSETTHIALINTADGNHLALTEPFDNTPFYLLSKKWNDVAAWRSYQGHPVKRSATRADARYEYTLADLFMDTATRHIESRVEWKLALPSTGGVIPPNFIPERINLDIVSTYSLAKEPIILSVYLNNILQEVVRIEETGKKQSFGINLSREHLSTFNEIRFVALRVDWEGDCYGDQTRYPIQILPESTLVVKKDISTPKRFSDIRAYLAEGYEIHLPQMSLGRPDETIAALARLTADMYLDPDYGKVVFYGGNTPVKPAAPFILIGRTEAEIEAPVHLDRGRVSVIDGEGNELLNTSDLININVAQMVKGGGNYGLWIAPAHSGDLTIMDTLRLDENNVAFLDSSDVLLTFDSKHDTFFQVDYPEHRTWFDVMGRYRFWLITLAWIVFAGIAVYIYRRTTKK